MPSPLSAFVPLLLITGAAAQGTAADYARAATVHQLDARVARFRPRLHWLPDGAGVWFARTLPGGGQEVVHVDARSGAVRTAADAAALGLPSGAAALPQLEPLRRWRASRASDRETSITLRNAFDRPIRVFWIDGDGRPHAYGELAPGASREQHTFVGHLWLADFTADDLAGVFRAEEHAILAVFDAAARLRAMGKAPEPAPRATARLQLRVHEHDAHGRDAAGDHRLTHDGSADDPYEAHFHVSPDGAFAFGLRTKPAQRHPVTLVEASPQDQLQPKTHTFDYLKPGDRIAAPRPRLFDLVAKRLVPIDDSAFADAWSIDHVHWAADSREVHCLYNRRGHQLLRLCAIDVQTGAVRTVVEERAATFVDYSQKTWLHWLDGGKTLLWASERDGFNHLYRVDVASGAITQLTQGPWLVREVERVDEAAGQVWFTAYGLHPGQDPYFAHLARIGLDGQGLVALTAANGTHEWSFSPDGSLLLARWSRVDQPTVTELRRAADGSLVAELGRDDARALLASGFRPPEPFVAKGRDGRTDIHGIVIRPSTFDAQRRYPVIESIYAGPQDHFVPKRFGMQTRERALAELGFVVVQIDGMGTNWRGKAFHDVCWKNLADGGLPDRVAWLRAAAQRFPELDLTRVGVFGGSAGGQNALAAVLHHGDVYHAAAADCGCHDNRMDKIWWNEAWMGWPIGPEYEANSNVTHAAKLRGKLLLTVGELDRNVDPASTMQVVKALIAADKDFELVVVPGGGHGIGESPYLVRRRQDFFVRALLGKEPRR